MAANRDVRAMRRAVGIGMRQINLLLIPAAAFMIVLATPIVRLLFQRGNFTPHSTHIVAVALFWFAFSLPFGGLNLLLTRTFFAVQRPWIPTRLAAINIVIDVIVSVGLYKPLGIAGLIIGTVVANAVMTFLQVQRLRIGFNGRLEGAQTKMITARILVASALLVVAVLGITFGVTSLQANRTADASIQRALSNTRGAVGAYLAGRTRAFAGMSSVSAEVPQFRERLLTSRDRQNVLDQAEEYRDLIGAAWVLVTNRDGILLARTDYPEEYDIDVSRGALIANALSGEQTSGAFIDDRDTSAVRLFMAVATPLAWAEIENTDPDAFAIGDVDRLLDRPDPLAELATAPGDGERFVAAVDAEFEASGLELETFDRFRS